VIAGLITLTLVGVLQSLGALADTIPVEPEWRSDAAGEDERGPAGRGAPGPDAVGAAAIDLPYRAELSEDAVTRTAAPASSVRLRSPDPRAPPALLARTSV
jgi:hypothetical protein